MYAERDLHFVCSAVVVGYNAKTTMEHIALCTRALTEFPNALFLSTNADPTYPAVRQSIFVKNIFCCFLLFLSSLCFCVRLIPLLLPVPFPLFYVIIQRKNNLLSFISLRSLYSSPCISSKGTHILPGAGSIRAAIITASGRQPDGTVGKPNPLMWEIIAKEYVVNLRFHRSLSHPSVSDLSYTLDIFEF